MKKSRLLVVLAVLVAVVVTYAVAEAGKPPVGGTGATNLVVGRPAKGMYCADPAGWINKGYGIYVWANGTPVKAQAFDAEGYLITPSIKWTVQGTNETGTMTLGTTTSEIDNKIFLATPKTLAATNIFTGDSNITYTADGKSFAGVVRRWNSKCDGCHSTPPQHALDYQTGDGRFAALGYPAGTSTCRASSLNGMACHPDFGAKMMESHAYRVSSSEQTTSAGCYRCHPSPCYGGIHLNKFPNDSVGCVTCHGSEIDAANGRMKVPGQLGFPTCQDCHVSANRQPVPYATNTGTQYKSSVGHGRTRAAKALCITCHNSMHMETKPTNWGDGANNNCVKCHVNKPTNNNMGPVCGNCHEDSINPHLVVK